MNVRSKTMKAGILALLLLAAAGMAWAQAPMPVMPGMIDGLEAPVDSVTGEKVFLLTAKTGYISTPEGNSVFVWGYALSDTDPLIQGPVQYPGPTLLVNQGDVVKVVLTNELPVPISMVFPGQSSVTAAQVSAPSQAGPLALEARPLEVIFNNVVPAGKVSYTFTASEPGTYLYHSGTRPDLQVDMGLFGAIVVRPALFDVATDANRRAYGHPDSWYDEEYLFLLSEIDPKIHKEVQYGGWNLVDTTTFFPTYWFINGRAAPDTMLEPYVSWLPTQPYNCMPMMEPGDRLLMRVIDAGRDLHPFHQHGNHAQVIARDARVLDLDALAPIDLSYEVFTFQAVPGQTMDGIFTWTGEGIGWDVYGHTPILDPVTGLPVIDPLTGLPMLPPLEPWESVADHGKPFPVLLPELQDLTFGGFWSGSPFLGSLAALPPGEGGMNPLGGFVYMWHSHTEKEMVNNDIFPGGMMTMLVVAPPGALMGGTAVMNIPQGGVQLQGGQ